MAIVLAVLDSKGVAHGPLECLFTWNEEDGLDGSAALSPDVLKSPYMIKHNKTQLKTHEDHSPWVLFRR